MLRFAANLAYLFTERPLIERFASAAMAGFRAVELQFPYDISPAAVKAELSRHGLVPLGLNTARGREDEFGLAAVPGREQDFAAIFRQALDYVVAIGGTAVHCLAGRVAPELRPAAEKVFIANLTQAADAAAEKGITLLIEPINQRDRPDYFLSRVEQAADVIARVGRPNVKMQFDIYHVQITQGDLITRFERHRQVIGHVQIAGVPARHEPDEGEVNYPEIFAALDRAGYRGWIACEYRPRGRTEDGLQWARPFGVRPRAG
ncbi:MAG: TIM barrel protein [Proteobacteria bacterium]|nr:TIM barrel protein [Pseudomonadota bacterium]